MQAKAAAKQHRPLGRGTHAKGVCARAQFEVFDVTVGRADGLADAARARECSQSPAYIPRSCGSGMRIRTKNSDFKADVRSLSFSVDLTRDGDHVSDAHSGRQDFSLQNTKTLPINDSPAISGDHEVAYGIESGRRLVVPAVQGQAESVEDPRPWCNFRLHQTIKPYQQLRYGSNVPFRHGPIDVVKHSATPFPDNPADPLQRRNPNGLQDELIRHSRKTAR